MDPLTIAVLVAGAAGLIACGSKGGFRYTKKNGEWRAYFRGDPPSRSHVLRDGDGYYVCWDRPLRTEADARRIAQLWTKKYG